MWLAGLEVGLTLEAAPGLGHSLLLLLGDRQVELDGEGLEDVRGDGRSDGEVSQVPGQGGAAGGHRHLLQQGVRCVTSCQVCDVMSGV